MRKLNILYLILFGMTLFSCQPRYVFNEQEARKEILLLDSIVKVMTVTNDNELWRKYSVCDPDSIMILSDGMIHWEKNPNLQSDEELLGYNSNFRCTRVEPFREPDIHFYLDGKSAMYVNYLTLYWEKTDSLNNKEEGDFNMIAMNFLVKINDCWSQVGAAYDNQAKP